MTRKGWVPLTLWCALLAGGLAWVQNNLVISADLRLFMPTPRTEAQRLLVQNLGESPASRLLLLAISGDSPQALARISQELAAGLSSTADFVFAANGAQDLQASAAALLPYRYLLTDSFDAQPLDQAQLGGALRERVEDLASPAGVLLEEWLPRDPTLEMLHLASQWQPRKEPRRIDDVWSSGDGRRALLVVETRAAAFDPDAQTQALTRLHAEFARARGSSRAELTVSGSGYFSSLMRNRTQREAMWLGTAATLGLAILMWVAYRQARFILFGTLPLLSAALAGLVTVSMLFDSVHGITLAFGFTLIGVAQDYPMHLFSHLRVAEHPLSTARRVWPPLRTGVASTCIAYLAFLLSGVTGLTQLACLTVTGLAVAALTTRFALPHVIGVADRDSAQSAFLGRWNARIERLPRPSAMLAIIPVLCGVVLIFRQEGFWQNDLSRLTPVSSQLLQMDATLRGELATPDLRYLLVVSGASQQAVLQRLATLESTLSAAVVHGYVGSYDHPAHYLPSPVLQMKRQAALPDAAQLRAMLSAAMADLPFAPGLFEPFVVDVARAKSLVPLDLAGLAATPLALRVSSSLFSRDEHWYGLVDFYDVRRPAELAASLRDQPATTFLDLKAASESLVAAQRAHLLLALEMAVLLLVAVVWLALRRPARVLRVLAPMVLTTLIILASLRASGVSLSLFHLISLVLAAGLGLDYALFFEHAAGDAGEQKRTLHALLVCSISTLLVFALLALSTVPVLRAIGITVSLGVVCNFVLALLLARSRPHQ